VFLIGAFNNQNKNDADLNKIRVSYDTEGIASSLLFDVAREQEYFTKNHLDVKEIPTDKQSINMISADKADICITNLIAASTLFLNDENFFWTSTVYKSKPDSLFVTKKLDTSKKIRFGLARMGGLSQIAADMALRSLGWGRENIEYVVAGDISTRWAYMERDEIDATLAYPGEGLRFMKEKNNLTSISPSDIYKGDLLLPVGVFVSEEMAQEKQKYTKDFLKAISETKAYIIRNERGTRAILEEKYGLNKDESHALYNELKEQLTNYLESRPETDLAPDLLRSVIEINEPANPGRPISDFIQR
jgi:ABC-type nitrate/sulfonate/bicarbonate transport system substrate-binding protein